MNKLRLLHWPLMWWRRKGFGIHSPFAFSLITRTIAERGEYYAYPELRRLAGKDFAKLSLIFRLICSFQPSTVRILSPDSRIESTVRLADSRISFVDTHYEMIIIDTLSSESLLKTIETAARSVQNIVILNLHLSLNLSIFNQLKGEGMTFTDAKTAIICLSPNLPRQSFTCLF